jgi:hypothetical protein
MYLKLCDVIVVVVGSIKLMKSSTDVSLEFFECLIVVRDDWEVQEVEKLGTNKGSEPLIY